MRFILIAIAGMTLISSVAAEPTWHTSKILGIYPQANGEFVITFVEDAPACTNTSTNKYFYARIGENGMTQEGLKVILATALTAAAAGKSVTINFDDSTSGCFINRLYATFAG